jgi:hypothetical protein
MNYHEIARLVLTHCPNQYAKSYAAAMLGLDDDNAQYVQALYIMSNISHWRGDVAKQCRAALKTLVAAHCGKSVPRGWSEH